jgi:hypothetical protein
MKIKISTSRIIVGLLTIVIALTLIDGIIRTIENIYGYENTTKIGRLFHTSAEGNIPSWFSSSLLLLSAFLSGVTAKISETKDYSFVRNWIALAIIFLYLSLDEAAGLHELSIDPLRVLLNTSGIFHFSWVIIALPLLLIFVGLNIKFLLYIPKDTRYLLVIAGGIYVSGALGMEMLDGYILSKQIVGGHIYGILTLIEEFLEHIGVSIFIYALLNYAKLHLQISDISLELT